ncbi:MAG: tRNA pseudouridine(38-40) synthase TruA [Rhodospirillales bacterium]|jgi:tRNA pseudouridine38-40 synthase|nr:tRNA pseudouridine(38-40) synthase TruA [Rhodospirillales bacterium]
MPRYRITIEYDGRNFVGWQSQDNGISVQQALEQAIKAFSGETSLVYAAGRTDAGVHALAQVAHFDLEQDYPDYKVMDALNGLVRPHRVCVLSIERTDEEFHSRFSATGRSYRYKILNRRAPPTVDEGLVWWVPVPLDSEAMHAAAQVLIGKHDFTTFRSVRCQAKSPVKTLDRLAIERNGDHIRIDVSARSFLHNQVRILVGTLRLIGEGKWNAENLKSALEACDRTRGGETAPPSGLYLSAVSYS